jgi:hypothetical protein
LTEVREFESCGLVTWASPLRDRPITMLVVTSRFIATTLQLRWDKNLTCLVRT